MQRVRRLASVAIVAAVAVTGLSACRTAPDVAAYMAAGNITVARVQQVFDDARSKFDRDAAKQAKAAPSAGAPSAGAPSAGASPAAAPATVPLTGAAVLDTLVSHDVLMRVAQHHNVQVPSPLPLQDYANILKLPVDSEFVRIYVEVEGLQYVLNQSVPGVTPTAADIRDVYERIKAQHAVDPGTTAEQFATTISAAGKKTLGSAVAVRDEVRADINAQHIKLNPRYQAFDLPVLTQRDNTGAALILMAIPVGDQKAAAPVTNVN